MSMARAQIGYRFVLQTWDDAQGLGGAYQLDLLYTCVTNY